MYEIEYTNRFKKNYKRIQKRGYDVSLLFQLVEQLVEQGCVGKAYKPHKLSGIYAGYWECHIQSDWLLIWEIKEQKNELFYFIREHIRICFNISFKIFLLLLSL
ncbi:MAG: type II toxin-antitoxin system YafQ family toxin [Prevotellaceae bacterium]|jgi:mRNA interferase YafQ|nr:type II toxin-antitoxin system YafQ family toxin [Prevotellaceae bacterium]